MTLTTVGILKERMTDIERLIKVMKARSLSHVFPNKSIGSLRDENILELIVDEEDTIFVLLKDIDEPFMIPTFAVIN